MKTNRHRTFWLAGLLGLAVLLFVNQTVQAQAVRGLANIAGKWGSGTPMISAGNSHTCALTGDGSVRCWGSNVSGQLGNEVDLADESSTIKRTPVVVKGVLTDAVVISAGDSHTCGVRANGRVMCWGANGLGQLGNGQSGVRSSTPVTVSGITNAVTVAAGSLYTCAGLATGHVVCWGSNISGQLGQDNTLLSAPTPVTVAGITNAVMVTAGGTHTCALLATGQIMCWGGNEVGQMGHGFASSTPQLQPRVVSGITNAVAISAGGRHTCALLATGSVACWGDNSGGQIGSQTLLFSQPIPVGITNAVAVAAGVNHTCALLATGNVQCWGRNIDGQLGGGNNSLVQPNPVTVSGIIGAVAITAGGGHTCAFITPSRTRCWGGNQFGQLGDGTSTPSNQPVTTALTRSISAGEVASGGRHSCAVRVDGTVSCWGLNSDGQLGNGTETNPSGPVAVSGLNTALSVELGARHSCALQTDGRVSCWGSNASGQLGVGLTFPATLKANRPVEPPRVSWRPGGVSQTVRVCSVS